MASLNLLAGYGSDVSDSEEESTVLQSVDVVKQENLKTSNFFNADDSSSSESESEGAILKSSTNRTAETNLKNPFRSTESSTGLSVFSNPFKEAEDAAKFALEQHVKFAPKLEDIKEINGRKICWNYRKGKCRFGSNCTFAHDCELLAKKLPPPVDLSTCVIASPEFADNNQPISSNTNKNKRPGLSQGIVPGKKVLKRYKQQQATEQPWTSQ